MTKRKKRKPQEEVAEEATQQQQRLKLQWAIATMRRLPKDFRDIDPGSKDWEDFANITGRRDEMTRWSNGPVLHLAPLNSGEKMILGGPNVLRPVSELVLANQSRIQVGSLEELTPENWIDVIQHAEMSGCSLIYLPDETLKVIVALNMLLSRFGFNVRVRGQVMSERTGKPIGIVH